MSRSALFLVLALAAGCGGGRGEVSGRVIYNGKPVPGGWVIFRPVDGSKNTVTVALDENGGYSATLPVGEVKLAVDNRELEPQPARNPRLTLPPGINLPPGAKPRPEPAAPRDGDRPQSSSGKYVAIPEKYHDVDTSELMYLVKKGPQTHDIELK